MAVSAAWRTRRLCWTCAVQIELTNVGILNGAKNLTPKAADPRAVTVTDVQWPTRLTGVLVSAWWSVVGELQAHMRSADRVTVAQGQAACLAVNDMMEGCLWT